MISGRLTRPAAYTLAALLDRAGDSRTVMRQLVNAAAARGLTPPWDVPPSFMDDNITVADTFAEDLPGRAPKFTARWEAANAEPVRGR